LCELTFDGEIYRCECECPVETASFTFRGRVREVLGCPPYHVQRDSIMEYTYWFVRNAPDLDPRPNTGTYNNIVCYELKVDGQLVAGGSPAGGESDVIIVRDNSGGSNGQRDAYEVRLKTKVDPHTEINFSIEDDDKSNDALTSDKLPLCGDLVLGTFNSQSMLLHGTPNPNCPGFQVVVKLVEEHACDNCHECPPPPAPRLPRPVGSDALGEKNRRSD